jgi:VWFA-related protein
MIRVALLIAASALLLAQEPIRVNTRLVQVNIVVRDSHGPVAGLSKDAFKVFDKGKERPIAVFFASTPNLAPGAVMAKTPGQPTPQPLPPGVVTNRRDVAPEHPVSATVFLIDAINTDPKDQQTARKQVMKFLAAMDTSRPMAIYLLASKIRVLQDFTDDPTLLQKAIVKFQGQGSSELRGANSTPLDVDPDPLDPTIAMMIESYNEMKDAHNVDRAQVTARAMEQIAAHLSRIPGRKTLIWLSSSFPFSLMNDERHNTLATARLNVSFNDEITRAIRALSAADIAIYPVDARGLVGMPAWDVTSPNSSVRRSFGSRGNGQLGAMSVDAPDGLETMSSLAGGTGGRMFSNSNDIQGAISAAMEDADVSYTIGFYASDPADNTFHPIKVTVDHPGAEARYRTNYFSTTVKVPGERDRNAILQAASASALDATAIGLTAAVERVNGSLHVAVQVDLNDASLDNQSGKWVGGMDVAFVSQAADGRSLKVASKSLTFNLTDEVYLARKRDGMVLDQTIDSDPKLSRIRVVVLDHRSGALGSLSLKP